MKILTKKSTIMISLIFGIMLTFCSMNIDSDTAKTTSSPKKQQYAELVLFKSTKQIKQVKQCKQLVRVDTTTFNRIDKKLDLLIDQLKNNKLKK